MSQSHLCPRPSRRRLLRLIGDSVPGLVSYIDPALHYRYMNACYREWFGVDPAHHVGRPVIDFGGAEAFVVFEPLLRRALAGERVVYERTPLFRIGGRRAFKGVLVPDFGRDGSVEGVVSIALDVSAEQVALDAVRSARDEAIRASAAKSRFLAVASHELRQPLHVLNLLVAELDRARADRDMGETIDHMMTAIASMQRMFDGLMNIYRLDAGAYRPIAQTIAAGPLFDRIASTFRRTAEAKEIELTVVGTRLTVESDPTVLEVILRNLVCNAVRYTDQGRVLLGARRRRDRIAIEVLDTGPGIAADRIEAAFDEFERLDRRSGASDEGLGLGLAIVRRLAHLVDAEIVVRSTVGRGSRFSVMLPRAQAAPATTRAGRRSGPPPRACEP